MKSQCNPAIPVIFEITNNSTRPWVDLFTSEEPLLGANINLLSLGSIGGRYDQVKTYAGFVQALKQEALIVSDVRLEFPQGKEFNVISIGRQIKGQKHQRSMPFIAFVNNDQFLNNVALIKTDGLAFDGNTEVAVQISGQSKLRLILYVTAKYEIAFMADRKQYDSMFQDFCVSDDPGRGMYYDFIYLKNLSSEKETVNIWLYNEKSQIRIDNQNVVVRSGNRGYHAGITVQITKLAAPYEPKTMANQLDQFLTVYGSKDPSSGKRFEKAFHIKMTNSIGHAFYLNIMNGGEPTNHLIENIEDPAYRYELLPNAIVCFFVRVNPGAEPPVRTKITPEASSQSAT